MIEVLKKLDTRLFGTIVGLSLASTGIDIGTLCTVVIVAEIVIIGAQVWWRRRD